MARRVFCSVKANWIFLSMFYFFHFSSVLAFNAGYCGQVTLPNKLKACSNIATLENLRSQQPFTCRRFGHSIRPLMSNSENNVWKNRGPFTLTKETEWKLTLSLTGPPQDGQFGPGCSVAFLSCTLNICLSSLVTAALPLSLWGEAGLCEKQSIV